MEKYHTRRTLLIVTYQLCIIIFSEIIPLGLSHTSCWLRDYQISATEYIKPILSIGIFCLIARQEKSIVQKYSMLYGIGSA